MIYGVECYERQPYYSEPQFSVIGPCDELPDFLQHLNPVEKIPSKIMNDYFPDVIIELFMVFVGYGVERSSSYMFYLTLCKRWHKALNKLRIISRIIPLEYWKKVFKKDDVLFFKRLQIEYQASLSYSHIRYTLFRDRLHDLPTYGVFCFDRGDGLYKMDFPKLLCYISMFRSFPHALKLQKYSPNGRFPHKDIETNYVVQTDFTELQEIGTQEPKALWFLISPTHGRHHLTWSFIYVLLTTWINFLKDLVCFEQENKIWCEINLGFIFVYFNKTRFPSMLRMLPYVGMDSYTRRVDIGYRDDILDTWATLPERVISFGAEMPKKPLALLDGLYIMGLTCYWIITGVRPYKWPHSCHNYDPYYAKILRRDVSWLDYKNISEEIRTELGYAKTNFLFEWLCDYCVILDPLGSNVYKQLEMAVQFQTFEGALARLKAIHEFQKSK